MKIHIHHSDDRKMFSIVVENDEPLSIEDLPVIFQKVGNNGEEKTSQGQEVRSEETEDGSNTFCGAV